MLGLDRQNVYRERYRRAQPGWQPATERFAAAVRAALQPDSRVLDLGCGRGGLVEQLSHPLSQVIGVDPDEQSLREHRLALPRVQALVPLPFAAASFDVVYASWVLEHWSEPQLALREIGRILKPGGRFIFITPNRRHYLIRLNRLLASTQALQQWLVDHLYGREAADTFAVWYRANDAASLHALAAQADLRLTALSAIADPSYLAFNEVLFSLASRLERRTAGENRLHLVGVMRKSAD